MNDLGPLDPRRDLIERLDFLAGMYGMGEKIAFGTDAQTALDAIARIQALEARVAEEEASDSESLAMYRSARDRAKHALARVAELEAVLASIAANTCCEGCQEAARVARAAFAVAPTNDTP